MREINKARIELVLLFLLFIFIMPRANFSGDFEFWRDWALQIHRHGLSSIYDEPTMDYHPLFPYFLWLYDKIQGSEYYIIQNINYIKFFPLFFDFLPVIVLCCFRQQIIRENIPYLFLLLNIAYLYNSMVWGQLDSIHTNLLFLAALLAFYLPIVSGVLFGLAICMKPHAIIFVPVLSIIWLYKIKDLKNWFLLALSIISTVAVVALPFILNSKMDKLWAVVTNSVGHYPYVSICAFNIWYLITDINPTLTNDNTIYFLFTYKQVGLILFFISSALILFPFLFRAIRSKISKLEVDNSFLQMTILSCGIIVLYFFYFNTQMHERYSHAMLIFFFFFGVLSKNYKLYFLASIPYLLSLDKCFPDFLPLQHFKIIWASKVIAVWYLLTVIYATYIYTKRYGLISEYRLLASAWNEQKNIS